MAKDDELKKSIKELVKEIVSDTVSKLVKASAMKTVTGLRDQLKEEAAKRVEDKLKKTAKELREELSSDTAENAEYVSKFNEAFEEKFQKLLTSLSKGLLKPLIIASACALVAGGVIGGLVIYNTTECPQPQPQPDLVITEVTFDVEVISVEAEPTPELMVTPELAEGAYQVTVHYIIENQGDKTAESSTSCLYLKEEVVAEDMLGPIAAGTTGNGTFILDAFSTEYFWAYLEEFGYIEIELRADVENVIEESNEENNSITLKINPPLY